MKQLLTILFFILSCSIFGQDTISPIHDTEVVRKVSILDIEGKIYNNVEVSMQSVSPQIISYKSPILNSPYYKVVITVRNEKKKQVWKKTLKEAYLYVFKNGQVQVGQQNFVQVLIDKSSETDNFIGKIREKEGIF